VPAVNIGNVVAGRSVAGAYYQRINDAGTLVYGATFGTPAGPVGIIRQSGATRELIAASGDHGPGMAAGETFSSSSFQSEIGPGVISGSGEVVFSGRIRHTSSEDYGLWSYRSTSDYINIIRSGTALPQLGAGVTAGIAENQVVDARGDTVFQLSLTGSGVAAGTSLALMSFDRDGGLQKVLRTGDSLLLPGEVSAGIVSGFAYSGFSGCQDGFASCLNDNGQLALRVTFTDGRSAIVTTTVPTPSVLLLALGLIVPSGRRRPTP